MVVQKKYSKINEYGSIFELSLFDNLNTSTKDITNIIGKYTIKITKNCF